MYVLLRTILNIWAFLFVCARPPGTSGTCARRVFILRMLSGTCCVRCLQGAFSFSPLSLVLLVLSCLDVQTNEWMYAMLQTYRRGTTYLVRTCGTSTCILYCPKKVMIVLRERKIRTSLSRHDSMCNENQPMDNSCTSYVPKTRKPFDVRTCDGCNWVNVLNGGVIHFDCVPGTIIVTTGAYMIVRIACTFAHIIAHAVYISSPGRRKSSEAHHQHGHCCVPVCMSMVNTCTGMYWTSMGNRTVTVKNEEHSKKNIHIVETTTSHKITWCWLMMITGII